MDALFKKSASSMKAKAKDSKKKAAATTNSFEKAKLLFPLHERAEAATERAWETYITNRLAAEKKFRGPREKRTRSPVDGEDNDDEEEVDEDEEDDCHGEDDEKFVLDLIRDNMSGLEGEMELDEGVLSKSFRLLSCDSLFEEEDQVSPSAHHAYTGIVNLSPVVSLAQ